MHYGQNGGEEKHVNFAKKVNFAEIGGNV